jgi:DNA-binding response OmpR family regulator
MLAPSNVARFAKSRYAEFSSFLGIASKVPEPKHNRTTGGAVYCRSGLRDFPQRRIARGGSSRSNLAGHAKKAEKLVIFVVLPLGTVVAYLLLVGLRSKRRYPDWKCMGIKDTIEKQNKILVVEDEPSLRWTLQEALRGWGYEPVLAATATEAQQAFAQAQPLAVLLDIHLPDGSGLDLLRSFKQRAPHTVVIMMTGEVVVAHTIAALRGGADDFIGKPIHLPELEYTLRTNIAQRRKGIAAPPHPPRLLIVADAQEQQQYLANAFSTSGAEITPAHSLAECIQACRSPHDLVIVDLPAEQVKSALEHLRASQTHAEIPVLVEVERILADRSLAGVLPQFRAMPCNQHEMVTLARRRLATLTNRTAAKALL